jgi:glycosyltransferase involved in cell wall biosynthesis
MQASIVRPDERGATEMSACRFEPVRVLQIELADELPDIPYELPTGARHRRALVLVRLHGYPVGTVGLELSEYGLGAAELARRIWRTQGTTINEHLVSDGLAPVAGPPREGLHATRPPACIERRQRALATAPPASIVIATRDRTKTLGACLDSLLALEYPSYEIVVVDSAPRTDATQQLLARRYACGELPIRYVHEPRPGLAVAHNRGLAEVTGAIVAFTDDDVVVDSRWLLELALPFESERVACVTGVILPAELETRPQILLEQYAGFAKGFEERRFDLFEHRPPAALFPYSAGMMGSGANMAFRTDVLRSLDGFDPATGAGSAAVGGDDLCAFFDVVTSGHTLVYAPSAIVWHRHRRDYASLRRQSYNYGVGLTAYLTKTVIDRPGRLLEVGRRLPHGFAHLLNPRSPKNVHKGTDYPKELTRLERLGMLRGPLAYVRSRRQSRRGAAIA